MKDLVRLAVRTEPVRLYQIAVTVAALGAYFLPSDAWPLVVAVVAAVLGQGVRSQVWSKDSHDRVMEQLVTVAGGVPDPVVGNLLPEDD